MFFASRLVEPVSSNILRISFSLFSLSTNDNFGLPKIVSLISSINGLLNLVRCVRDASLTFTCQNSFVKKLSL